MRTTVQIDTRLLEIALRESRLRSRRAVAEAGLRRLVQRERRKRLVAAFGKYPWHGDLSAQRRAWERH